MKLTYANVLLFLLYWDCKQSALADNIGCNPPVPPSNGDVKLLSKNQVIALYRCHSGYKLIGHSYRDCENDGKWSGSMPSCKLDEDEESSANLGTILSATLLPAGLVAVLGVVYIYYRKKVGSEANNGCLPFHMNFFCCSPNHGNLQCPQVDTRTLTVGTGTENENQISYVTPRRHQCVPSEYLTPYLCEASERDFEDTSFDERF